MSHDESVNKEYYWIVEAGRTVPTKRTISVDFNDHEYKMSVEIVERSSIHEPTLVGNIVIRRSQVEESKTRLFVEVDANFSAVLLIQRIGDGEYVGETIAIIQLDSKYIVPVGYQIVDDNRSIEEQGIWIKTSGLRVLQSRRLDSM